ncbi:hypothetical protein MNBD_GAMMA26-468 [hydrothermal vent metagenome]|uniref:Uncharacterized protein n=1 Tax=hydrothermal vent metagenome TaxID=652676 RepID=A0A3B1B3X3_9ZZZZ
MANKYLHDGGKMDKSDNKQSVSRRGFLEKIAIGGAAIGASAGLFKIADSMAPDVDQQLATKQDADAAAGDRALANEEYVLMSRQEKDEIVQMFVDNYPNKSTEII